MVHMELDGLPVAELHQLNSLTVVVFYVILANQVACKVHCVFLLGASYISIWH